MLYKLEISCSVLFFSGRTLEHHGYESEERLEKLRSIEFMPVSFTLILRFDAIFGCHSKPIHAHSSDIFSAKSKKINNDALERLLGGRFCISPSLLSRAAMRKKLHPKMQFPPVPGFMNRYLLHQEDLGPDDKK